MQDKNASLSVHHMHNASKPWQLVVNHNYALKLSFVEALQQTHAAKTACRHSKL